MVSLCYNCLKPGHQSIRCPEPSRYTRCFSCSRVCETPNDHFFACSNKEFKSRFIHPGSTKAATLVADLKISTIFPLYLMDRSNEIDLSADFPPMKIDTDNGLLLGKAKSIEYYQWFPSIDKRCVINVMDAENTVRFSVRLQDEVFIINKSIRVRKNGAIEYRNEKVLDLMQKAELTLKVDTVRKFSISIYAFKQRFTFEVSRDGILYVHPGWTTLECVVCFDNMFEKTIKKLKCGHLFCSPCIYQALEDATRCPLCREKVRLDDLSDIYLHN